MKKNKPFGELFYRSLKKIFLTMRIIIILLFLGILQAHANEAYSQKTRLSLNFSETELVKILDKIEVESEFFFLYNEKLLDTDRKVNITANDQLISVILDNLFAGTDVKYSIIDRKIILAPDYLTKESDADAIMQQQVVTGTVTDENGNPLPGVNVQVEGTTIGSITDINGKYSITISDLETTLIFSFIGYRIQEIPVEGRFIIDLSLMAEITGLDEVIVTGYMTQKKVDLTGAVSVVDVTQLVDRPTSNPMQTLQGRVPGLYIETSGSPTGETRTLLIRGKNTLGNTDPLYIIDGVPTKRSNVMQSIDPNAIESIQILKDASAASIYGARASNGVIIVTTKQGKQRLQAELTTSMTVQNYSLMNKVDMLNTLERGEILWQASINDKTNPTVHSALYSYEWHTDAQGNAVLDKVIPAQWVGGESYKTKAQVPGTDWQDIAYRNALQSNTSLSVSGITENSTALLGLGYLNNQGILKYTDFKKISIRLNTSHIFFKGKLKIGENLQLAKTTETPSGGDLGGPFNPLGQRYSGGNMHSLAVMLQPILPVYREDGEWAGPVGSGFSDRNNVLHMLYIHRNNKKNDYITFGNIYAELRPIKNMAFLSNFGLDYTNSYGWWFEEQYSEGFLRKALNTLDVLQEHRIILTWSNTLNYNLTLGRHIFNMLAGMEAIKEDYFTMGGRKENFAIQDVAYRYLSAGTGSQNTTGTSTGYQLLSYFGKVNYSLSRKYLASITLRYDGSSRFGTENQFGIFPALTVGWRINNEEFFKIPIISNLKLRAGVGRVGNQEIGDMARFGLYAPNYGTQSGGVRNIGSAYDIYGVGSGTLSSGFVSIQTENQSLKWESTDELNVGIDFGFLEENIFGSFDYFTRETKDILVMPPYPGVVGEGGSRWENGATIENKGYEIVLGYRNQKGNLSYNILGSISSFHDIITKLPEEVISAYPGNTEKTIMGHSQTSVFGYVTNGIFQTKEEVASHAVQAGKAIGRIRWADLNNDGKIDPLDQDWLGTTLPDFEYGISGELGYKNFTLSLFMQGVSGKKIFNSQKSILTLTHAASGMNYGKATFEGWTTTNTDTDIPAQSLINSNNETRSSDYLYVNGSYFKLRTLQFSYLVPEQFIKKIRLNQLRIYLMGENLLMIKDTKGKDRYFGTDPEIANWQYPRPTNLTLGLNIKF